MTHLWRPRCWVHLQRPYTSNNNKIDQIEEFELINVIDHLMEATDVMSEKDVNWPMVVVQLVVAQGEIIEIDVEVTYLNEGVERESVEGPRIDEMVLAQGFLEEEDDFQCLLGEGGMNPSKRVDKWALNRINKFRCFKGFDRHVTPFKHLPSPILVSVLTKFFEQV